MKSTAHLVALLASATLAQANSVIQIETKIFEMDEKVPADLTQTVDAVMNADGAVSSEEFQKAIRALDGAKHVDLMSAPTVTTKSGLPALIKVIREFKFPSEYERSKAGKLEPSKFETRNIGVEVEITPTMDGGKIRLTGLVRQTNFEGYTKSEDRIQPPIFTVREARFLRVLGDGQSIGMWGWTRTDKQQVTDTKSDGTDAVTYDQLYERRLGIFITAKLVDSPAAGPQSTPARQTRADMSYGKPVKDQPGFVTSPYAPDAGSIDVRGFPSDTEVKCPYTGKIFLVP